MIEFDGKFRDKWQTGDGPLTGSVFFTLIAPQSVWFHQHIADALWALTQADNWEQLGTATIDEAVQTASEVFMSFGTLVGAIFPVAWDTIPDGFLACDGAAYNRVDYPALYNVLASAFLVDTDTFIVPDLSGKTIIGNDDLNPVGYSGGEASHVLTVNEMPSHTHSYTNALPILTAPPLGTGANEINPIPVNTGAAGGDQSHNNMQPYVVLRYVIGAR